MKLLYSILCSDILTDRETGSTTYIRTIDQISTPGIPILIPSLSIGTCWKFEKGDEKEYDVKIEIANPSEERKPQFPIFKLKAEKDKLFHRINIRLSPFQIEKTGNYIISFAWKLRTSTDWIKEESLILSVILKKMEKEVIH